MPHVPSLVASIGTAPDLWRAFCARAGLDLKERKDKREAHDAELISELRKTLALPNGIALDQAMEQAGTTTEALLNAILAKLTPWSRMMRDILEMVEQARGGADTEALSINVQWDALDEELQVSLSEFRRQQSVIQHAMLTSTGSAWGRFDFSHAYPHIESELGYNGERGSSIFGRSADDFVGHDLRYWFRSLWDGVTDPPPQIQLNSDPDFEALLARLRSAVASHMRVMTLMGGGRYADTVDTPADMALPDDWTVVEARRLHNDYLSAWPLVWYAAAPRLYEWSSLRTQIMDHLRMLLDQVPSNQERWVEAARALDDVLDLPVWKKRHELYSVWVATQIASSSGRAPDWILTNGVLSFSFAGADVARFPLSGGTALLRAESREETTVALKGSGRKHAVQPDYTVYREHAGRRTKAGLVVECKHYRIAARKSFEDAIWDYARAHADASVLLVNYTRIGEITLPAHGSFSGAYGEMRPSGSGVAAFREQVSGAFTQMDEASDVFGGRASIRLHWKDGGDLDLHVARKRDGVRTTVHYSSRGSISAEPWMELQGDQQFSPAIEEVKILKAGGDAFEVYVHRFQGEWPRQGFFVEVEAGAGRKRIDPPEYQAGADWWHVCDVSLNPWKLSTGTGFRYTPP
ncbi:hypothetical protein [Stenotrophomonas sp. PS02300]|uniref:hypothetical protein n=1 Tax=Stenotrophomonas sp. PS02300 TaxID=2991426 RepID=UPI00249B4D9F|nr:hypothetical protein [Stenotrophomonas sp. PS02300]